MHRFGRSAQHKTKDRWGGSFVLATILALVGAWVAGTYLSNALNGTTVEGPAGFEATPSVRSDGGEWSVMADPQEYTLHFVQVGAFRSADSAHNAALALGENNYSAMVAPATEDGFNRVYAGVYTTQEAAENVKAQLQMAGYEGAFSWKVRVPYNPDAVPAMTTTTTMGPELQKGLDIVNTYLYEVARWFEGRAEGMEVDTNRVVELGRQLGDYVTTMGADQDPKVMQFVEMAALASAHAESINNAATSMASSDDFQAVSQDYLKLVRMYTDFYGK